MSTNVSKEQIQAARHTDLYDFLVRHHDPDFTHEGDSIKPKNNHSISVRRGYSGYKDFSTGETGNSVEFLTRHMGYGFVHAVQALAGMAAPSLTSPPAATQPDAAGHVPPGFPAPVDGMYRILFAYLTNPKVV